MCLFLQLLKDLVIFPLGKFFWNMCLIEIFWTNDYISSPNDLNFLEVASIHSAMTLRLPSNLFNSAKFWVLALQFDLQSVITLFGPLSGESTAKRWVDREFSFFSFNFSLCENQHKICSLQSLQNFAKREYYSSKSKI